MADHALTVTGLRGESRGCGCRAYPRRRLLIGAWFNPALAEVPEQRGDGFAGCVRNVRLWGKALTPEEVARAAEGQL